jgi:hypothetical protein
MAALSASHSGGSPDGAVGVPGVGGIVGSSDIVSTGVGGGVGSAVGVGVTVSVGDAGIVGDGVDIGVPPADSADSSDPSSHDIPATIMMPRITTMANLWIFTVSLLNCG